MDDVKIYRLSNEATIRDLNQQHPGAINEADDDSFLLSYLRANNINLWRNEDAEGRPYRIELDYRENGQGDVLPEDIPDAHQYNYWGDIGGFSDVATMNKAINIVAGTRAFHPRLPESKLTIPRASCGDMVFDAHGADPYFQKLVERASSEDPMQAEMQNDVREALEVRAWQTQQDARRIVAKAYNNRSLDDRKIYEAIEDYPLRSGQRLGDVLSYQDVRQLCGDCHYLDRGKCVKRPLFTRASFGRSYSIVA